MNKFQTLVKEDNSNMRMWTNFIIISGMASLICMANTKKSNSDNFNGYSDTLTQRHRQSLSTKNEKQKSLLERLLEVKSNIESTSNQNSRAINYQSPDNFEIEVPSLEELKQKLKFDLEPTATIDNQTLIIDGLSVSTNEAPHKLSGLNFDRDLLSQLGSLLPGGGPSDNVQDIHAELQGMLFGEDDVEEGNDDDTIPDDDYTYDTLETPADKINEEDINMYDLLDYTDYTEESDNEHQHDENKNDMDSNGSKHMSTDDIISSIDYDQAPEESVLYTRNTPVNLLNISSSPLPLVGQRRKGSFARFPERHLAQQQNIKRPQKSRLRNKQRLLAQTLLQNGEASSRIISRKPNRNRQMPESKLIKNDFNFDYEGIV